MTTDLNTAFRHRLFYLRRSCYQHVCSLVNKFRTAKKSGERFLPLPKCRRDTESAPVWSNAAKCDVLAVVGARPRRGQGSVESMDFPDIFCLSYMFSLRQVGEKD